MSGVGLEIEVERECLVWLNANGFFAWKNPTLGVYDTKSGNFRKPAPFCIRGSSDCISVRSDGVVVFIEFKSGTGKQSKDQVLFEKQIRKHHGHYLLIRSLGELQDEINRI